MKRLHREG